MWTLGLCQVRRMTTQRTAPSAWKHASRLPGMSLGKASFLISPLGSPGIGANDQRQQGRCMRSKPAAQRPKETIPSQLSVIPLCPTWTHQDKWGTQHQPEDFERVTGHLLGASQPFSSINNQPIEDYFMFKKINSQSSSMGDSMGHRDDSSLAVDFGKVHRHSSPSLNRDNGAIAARLLVREY